MKTLRSVGQMTENRKFQFKRSEISETAWIDILRLHKSYYTGESIPSRGTSSHWDAFSNFQSVSISFDEINLQGFGFGDYENSKNLSFSRKMVNFPMLLVSEIVLAQVPANIRSAVRKVASSTSRSINPDFARLAKSLQMVTSIVPDFENKKRVAIIGDGFGTFGALLASLIPNITIFQINLGRQLLFDYLFMVSSHPQSEHRILHSINEVIEGEINYLPAELVSCLDANIDVFISIESFQEMNLETIKDYFELMRSQSAPTFLYCANRVSKKLPDGKLIELEKYGWSINDIHLSISSRWWLNWGIKRRPPFIFKMDGRIEERITKISKT